MIKSVRIEKAHNGYLIKIGGPGSVVAAEQWIAISEEEVAKLVGKLLTNGKKDTPS